LEITCHIKVLGAVWDTYGVLTRKFEEMHQLGVLEIYENTTVIFISKKLCGKS
jgi:hypothetical protein